MITYKDEKKLIIIPLTLDKRSTLNCLLHFQLLKSNIDVIMLNNLSRSKATPKSYLISFSAKNCLTRLFKQEINLQRDDEQAHLLASLVMEPL